MRATLIGPGYVEAIAKFFESLQTEEAQLRNAEERLLNIAMVGTVGELIDVLLQLPRDADVFGLHEEPLIVAHYESAVGRGSSYVEIVGTD